jgi:ATP-dependent DNA helicase RecG
LPDDLKVNELKKSHRSHPVNPDIAHMVFLRGLIDKLGRGTLKVVDECRKEGLKDPVWKDDTDGITLTFYGPKALAAKRETNKNHTVNDTVNDAVSDAVSDAVKRGLIDAVSDPVIDALIDAVKAILTDNAGVSINEVMNKTRKSNATVKRYLQILKTINLIEFKGAAKTGRYFIIPKVLTEIKKIK